MKIVQDKYPVDVSPKLCRYLELELNKNNIQVGVGDYVNLYINFPKNKED
jgi:hypothetical protein